MGYMADRHDNVVMLPGQRQAVKSQLAHVDVLRATVEQLDELGYRLQQLTPHSTWPTQRWMIASTPFRMRLASARKRLNDLGGLNIIIEQNANHWTFELNDARLEAERRLQDIDACLHVLQSVEASPSDRARDTEIFAYNKAKLLKALRAIRQLIAQRFPAVLGDS